MVLLEITSGSRNFDQLKISGGCLPFFIWAPNRKLEKEVIRFFILVLETSIEKTSHFLLLFWKTNDTRIPKAYFCLSYTIHKINQNSQPVLTPNS